MKFNQVIGSILLSSFIILSLSACNIQSKKLTGTSWVIDLQAYSSTSPPKGFEREGTSIEFEQDSIYTGSIYQLKRDTNKIKPYYYKANAKIPITYQDKFILDSYSKKGDTLEIEVKKHIVDKCLILSIPYVDKDVHLKPAPEFDRNNVYKVSEEVQRQFKEAMENGSKD